MEWILPEDLLKETASISNITGPFIRKLMNKAEVAITEAPTAELVQQIRSRQWSANQVALAYCKRTAFTHQLVCSQADCSSANALPVKTRSTLKSPCGDKASIL